MKRYRKLIALIIQCNLKYQIKNLLLKPWTYWVSIVTSIHDDIDASI